ncbi:MAG: sensor histidine kinase [Candidatus Omnitrophota bacterium]
MTENKTKLKTSIRRKVIILICLSTFIVMLFSIVFAYLIGFNAIYESASDIHRKFSQLLVNQISQKFDFEMENIKEIAIDPVWPEAVETKTDVAKLVAKLKSIMSEDENISGISIIDKAGNVVVSSDKAVGIHVPEAKALMDFSLVKPDRVFIGDTIFDNFSKSWIIPISIPIKDLNGDIVGLLRLRLSSSKFFAPLAGFRVDLTGHASVIDGKGNIIYHPGFTQTNVRLCSDKDYRKLLTSKTRSAIIYDINIHKDLLFDSFSDIARPVLLDNEKVWRVLIEQDLKEILIPLNRTVAWLMLAIVFLLVLMATIGFVFSTVLTKPVHVLYKAAIEIMKGNWDYDIDVKTGDEIERFADAFKEMIATIKINQHQLIKAKSELEALSKGLEEKVRARTIDLTLAKDKLDTYAKELERAVMVKSDFVSMASHELRTPLAAIKEGIGIVLEGKAGGVTERQVEFLDMAKRNVDRLARLINDILDLQKLEQGKMTMKIRDNNINETVCEVCEMMSHVAKDKKLKIIMSLSEDLPIISFDKDKIIQVLMNLMSNAIKFTEKGTVTVSTIKDNNTVQVSVSDTGVGIKKDDIQYLFQKFSQLEMGLERKSGGTGLGLIISKEIIERHKGRIWVETKFGDGTTFHFTLPIKERRA